MRDFLLWNCNISSVLSFPTHLLPGALNIILLSDSLLKEKNRREKVGKRKSNLIAADGTFCVNWSNEQLSSQTGNDHPVCVCVCITIIDAITTSNGKTITKLQPLFRVLSESQSTSNNRWTDRFRQTDRAKKRKIIEFNIDLLELEHYFIVALNTI